MIRKLLLIVFITYVFVFCGCRKNALYYPYQPTPTNSFSFASPGPSPAYPFYTPVHDAVYITAGGKKYHTEGCRYLKGTVTELGRQDAEKKGYQSCSVCKP